MCTRATRTRAFLVVLCLLIATLVIGEGKANQSADPGLVDLTKDRSTVTAASTVRQLPADMRAVQQSQAERLAQLREDIARAEDESTILDRQREINAAWSTIEKDLLQLWAERARETGRTDLADAIGDRIRSLEQPAPPAPQTRLRKVGTHQASTE